MGSVQPRRFRRSDQDNRPHDLCSCDGGLRSAPLSRARAWIPGGFFSGCLGLLGADAAHEPRCAPQMCAQHSEHCPSNRFSRRQSCLGLFAESAEELPARLGGGLSVPIVMGTWPSMMTTEGESVRVRQEPRAG